MVSKGDLAHERMQRAAEAFELAKASERYEERAVLLAIAEKWVALAQMAVGDVLQAGLGARAANER